MRPRVPPDRRPRNGWQKRGCFSVVPLLYLVMATLPSLPVTLAVLTLSDLAAGPINLVVTAYGFFNPAFRAMDGEQPRSRERARRHAGLPAHSRYAMNAA